MEDGDPDAAFSRVRLARRKVDRAIQKPRGTRVDVQKSYITAFAEIFNGHSPGRRKI
jgi:hypothetical protein